jgi:alpha-ribazole phosphatase
MAVRLLLIRHAATEAGNRKRLVGSTDVPASETGLRELSRLPGVLQQFAPEAWYCSPLQRVRQTVERLREIDPVHREFIVDERLREIDFGRWEMKSFGEIAEAEPDAVRSWLEFDSFVFPEGEGVRSFQERIRGVLADLSRSGAKEIGVVTHGGVIRTMICLALGLSPANYLLFDVRPASMAVIDLDGAGGVLTGLNV